MLAANHLKKIHLVFSSTTVYEWNRHLLYLINFGHLKKLNFLLSRSKFSVLDIKKMKSLWSKKQAHATEP